MRMLITSICLAISLGVGHAQDEPVSLQERVDALFAAYEVGDRPGYAIGVVRNGEVIASGGYGLADIEASMPITADTALNLASLSKQFTGASLAKELQAGTLSLDDLLADHWENLPAFMSDITLGHLAYMSSGLPDYYNLRSPKGGWSSEDRFTVDDAISAVFENGRLDDAPGTRWTYSNINYQLLAVLTARLNGSTFAEHMQAIVFAPLGMESTWVDAPIDADRNGRATSYYWDDRTAGWVVAPRLSPHYGGSGIYSSINDLARWNIALYDNKAFGADFTEIMLATRRYEHDKTNDALGLVHSSYQGNDIIWYEGGDYGVSTYMVHLPERSETVICLANFADARCADKARAVVDVMLAFPDD